MRNIFLILTILIAALPNLRWGGAVNPSPSPDPNSSQFGTVTLLKDESGFYAAIDLDYDNTHTTDILASSFTVPVIISLYSSHTLFAENCLDFKFYDCEQYSCTRYKDETHTIEFPYFTERGYSAQANAYLDYNHWKLNTRAAIAEECISKGNYPLGSDKFGIVGLGLAGKSRDNFIESLVFSVYLKQDYSEGYLLFRKDLTKAVSKVPNVVLKANENWEVTVKGVQISDYAINNNANLRVIFDLNADSIGLPIEVFRGLLDYLSRESFLDCTKDFYKPNCTYRKPPRNLLPDIILHTTHNSTIKIPPRVYVNDRLHHLNTSLIPLNFRGLDSSFQGQSYITPSYSNYIILGYPFLSHYYSVFEASPDSSAVNYTISLYIASDGESTRSWVGALLGPLVVVVLFALCWVGCHRLSKHKELHKQSSILSAGGGGVSQRSPNVIVLSPLLSPRVGRSRANTHLSRFAAYKPQTSGRQREAEEDKESNFQLQMD